MNFQGDVHEFSREVQNFSGKVLNHLRGDAYLPTPPLKIRVCKKGEKKNVEVLFIFFR